MTLVALSASYGAGGSWVGPELAKRLDVPFLDRAIPIAVAERLDVPVDEATAYDEQPGGSVFERLLQGFIGGDAGIPTPVLPDTLRGEDFRRATEEVLLRQAGTGAGVILGRGAVVVLRDDPRVLRVRLDGPPDRRVAQAMRLEGLDRETAERGRRQLDRMHADYVRHFHGAELTDPSLYHLVIDTTAITLPACIDMIVAAVEAFAPEHRLAGS